MKHPPYRSSRFRSTKSHSDLGLGGTVCPARDLRRGQSSPRKIEACPVWQCFWSESRNCAKFGKSQGSQPECSPFSSHMPAGQTFPLGLISLTLKFRRLTWPNLTGRSFVDRSPSCVTRSVLSVCPPSLSGNVRPARACDSRMCSTWVVSPDTCLIGRSFVSQSRFSPDDLPNRASLYPLRGEMWPLQKFCARRARAGQTFPNSLIKPGVSGAGLIRLIFANFVLCAHRA